jgi:hypothetical protein
MLNRFSSKCLNLFLNYSSNREVQIPNTFIATIHRILQLIVLGYIFPKSKFVFLFSYIVWRRKGYQLFEEPRGTSVIKVKGVGKISIGNTKIYHEDDRLRILWDASEYGISPLVCLIFYLRKIFYFKCRKKMRFLLRLVKRLVMIKHKQLVQV